MWKARGSSNVQKEKKNCLSKSATLIWSKTLEVKVIQVSISDLFPSRCYNFKGRISSDKLMRCIFWRITTLHKWIAALFHMSLLVSRLNNSIARAKPEQCHFEGFTEESWRRRRRQKLVHFDGIIWSLSAESYWDWDTNGDSVSRNPFPEQNKEVLDFYLWKTLRNMR